MNVLLSVENNAGLESNLDKRFGRAGYFLVYDTSKNEILSIVENEYKNMGHGVGVKAATYVVESGCRGVICAQPGPKAAAVLQQSGVKLIVDDRGTVKEALEKHADAFTG